MLLAEPVIHFPWHWLDAVRKSKIIVMDSNGRWFMSEDGERIHLVRWSCVKGAKEHNLTFHRARPSMATSWRFDLMWVELFFCFWFCFVDLIDFVLWILWILFCGFYGFYFWLWIFVDFVVWNYGFCFKFCFVEFCFVDLWMLFLILFCHLLWIILWILFCGFMDFVFDVCWFVEFVDFCLMLQLRWWLRTRMEWSGCWSIGGRRWRSIRRSRGLCSG